MKAPVRIALFAGLAGVSIAAAAAAVSGSPGCGGFGPGHGGHGPGMMDQAAGPGHAGFAPEEMAAHRLDQLKTSLKLQPEQEKAWADFAAAVTAQAKRMGEMRGEMRNTARTAPERTELAGKLMEERKHALDEVGKAMKGLYAVLSPEQRKLLDGRGPWHHG
jgi:hypothetical protein